MFVCLQNYLTQKVLPKIGERSLTLCSNIYIYIYIYTHTHTHTHTSIQQVKMSQYTKAKCSGNVVE